MTTVLVAIPTSPRYPDALRQQAERLAFRLPAANPDLRFEFCVDSRPVVIPADSPIYSRHAIARNRLIDTALQDHHEYVLWVDADLCAYPADLPTRLLAANPGGIAAPFVYLDKCAGPRFYDIGGFIHGGGQRFPLYGPFPGEGEEAIELESVGCCYLIPAALYRAGLRYAPPADPTYVEHWSVMREARARGVRVVALPQVAAVHAWLPDYGLELS